MLVNEMTWTINLLFYIISLWCAESGSETRSKQQQHHYNIKLTTKNSTNRSFESIALMHNSWNGQNFLYQNG